MSLLPPPCSTYCVSWNALGPSKATANIWEQIQCSGEPFNNCSDHELRPNAIEYWFAHLVFCFSGKNFLPLCWENKSFDLVFFFLFFLGSQLACVRWQPKSICQKLGKCQVFIKPLVNPKLPSCEATSGKEAICDSYSLAPTKRQQCEKLFSLVGSEL